MSEIRVTRAEACTIVPNSVVNDSRLTWEARGMLVYLLGNSANGTIRIGDLIHQAPCGRDKTRRILEELEKAGYIRRTRKRNEDGTLGWEVLISL